MNFNLSLRMVSPREYQAPQAVQAVESEESNLSIQERAVRNLKALGMRIANGLKRTGLAIADFVVSYFAIYANLIAKFQYLRLKASAVIEAVVLALFAVIPATAAVVVFKAATAVVRYFGFANFANKLEQFAAGVNTFATKCKERALAMGENLLRIKAPVVTAMAFAFNLVTGLGLVSFWRAVRMYYTLFPAKLMLAAATVATIWPEKVNANIQKVMQKLGLAQAPATASSDPVVEEELAANDRVAELAGAALTTGVAYLAAPVLLAGTVLPSVVAAAGMVAGPQALHAYRRYAATPAAVVVAPPADLAAGLEVEADPAPALVVGGPALV